jgi:hypothetical protein
MLLLSRGLLVALTLTVIAPAFSQDPNAEPEASESVETGSEATTDAPAPAPSRDESPLDYESSEQISEDLSVSFPVDI